jgi:recombination protein RecT
MTSAVARRDTTSAMTDVRKMLAERESQLVSMLGPTIPVDRFLMVAMHAVNSNPDLLACTPLSIVEAIREAAALRLEPTGLLGDAYLVRYGDKARLMPGYRGLAKLARRSGDVEVIDAQVVYQHDVFDLRLGSDPGITHVPVIDGDRGSYRGAYAWARLTTGELVVEWMSLADIEAVRKVSKAKNDGPWVTFWSEMARKSALRRLMKHLPLSTDAEQALRLESEAEQAAVQEAPRRPSAAVTAIHARLGIPPVVDDEPPLPDEPHPVAASGEVSDGVTTTAPSPALNIPDDLQAGMDLLR